MASGLSLVEEADDASVLVASESDELLAAVVEEALSEADSLSDALSDSFSLALWAVAAALRLAAALADILAGRAAHADEPARLRVRRQTAIEPRRDLRHIDVMTVLSKAKVLHGSSRTRGN
jgi:hypothetical protein